MIGKAISALAMAAALSAVATSAKPTAGLASLPKVGTVDQRFLSYNVEMVEVTGGRFWRPYGSSGTDRYEYRPPMDLGDGKLRQLARALGPAYVRVSGTWANATYFADTDSPPEKASAGFDTVLTRAQWRGVIDFARAVDAKIVTSFATSPGARDANGVWTSDQATRWLAYTRSVGGEIAAAEFANEPNMLWLTQPPKGYDGADYRRDYARFAGWLRQNSPKTLLLAPGIAEIGEPFRTMMRERPQADMPRLEGSQLIDSASPRPDRFSYHFYNGGSQRCGKIPGFDQARALTPGWLDEVDRGISRVRALRDAVAPGVELWNTEQGETACGGNPWASSLVDSFRFVDTLGRSARQGVTVFMHNTLAASDYALLDEHSYNPRPNYWAAVLWKRTMGATVLAPSGSQSPTFRLYAHCLPGRRGVGIAAINIGERAEIVPLGRGAKAWVMQATPLDGKTVTINGRPAALTENGTLSGLEGAAAGTSAQLPAKAIGFYAVEGVRNPACR